NGTGSASHPLYHAHAHYRAAQVILGEGQAQKWAHSATVQVRRISEVAVTVWKGERYWSHPPGSNRRPADYESAALPTELGWLSDQNIIGNLKQPLIRDRWRRDC